MGKKVWILILILFLLAISGCGNRHDGLLRDEPDFQPTPEKSKLMEGFQENLPDSSDRQSGQIDEDIKELNKWKYGARPGAQSFGTRPADNTLVISIEEMDINVKKLVDEGYLDEQVRDMGMIQQAIVEYQNDHGISSEEQVQSITLDILTGKSPLPPDQ